MAVTWISRTAANINAQQTVAHNGVRFAALNNSGSLTSGIMVSVDGIAWSNVSTAEAFEGKRLHWNGTQFLGLSMQFPPKVLTSPDGLTWTRSDFIGSSFNPYGIAWNGTTYVGTASSGNVVSTSPNGITWTERTATGTPGFGDIIWTGSKFIIAGSIATGLTRVSTSSDGITWTDISAASPNDLSCIAVNGSTIVAMSISGAFAYVSTNDGATWTSHATGGVAQINSICFGSGVFVAVGEGATLISPNGVTWTVVAAAEANSWTDVAFGSSTFVAVSSNGSGVMSGQTAQSSAVLSAPTPSLFTVENARIIAPTPTIAATGSKKSYAFLTSPAASLSAFAGANAALTASRPILQALGRDSSGDNSFDHSVPIPELLAYGGANAAISALPAVLGITGTFTVTGQAELIAPTFKLSATGTTSGVGNASIASPSAKIIGYSGAVCSITVGGATLQATGTSGSIGGAAITCPLFELTASGTKQNSGKAELLAPAARLGATAQAYLIAPGAQLTAIGSAVVTATYEAYSVNLTHKVRTQGDENAVDEVTRYTNFPFTHVVRYQNSYFGVAADGLYLLEGTTDNGVAIAYTVRTAVDDFDVPQKKILSAAYLAGRVGPTMTTTVYAGETGQNVYPYSTPRGQGAQNHREKFGKGVKDRYFALGLSGTDVMEIDGIELEDNKLNRRI